MLSAGLCPAAPVLSLATERSSRFDLALTGELAGVPTGTTRYVRWENLRALPTSTLKVEGEFVPGEQEITVAFLDDVWKALPRAAGADTVIAACSDGYASIYTTDFIASYRPFVVLEINGQGPEAWPPEGLNFNPGPYVISVSEKIVPAVKQLLDPGHKRPWGVGTLEIATYQRRLQPFYSGARAHLSPAAERGREIWINSCFSCHTGPAGAVGGTKAGRPFEVLAAHAGYNTDYFRRYVRDPRAVLPGAKMEPHPHYTDEQLDALIAFLVAPANS